MKVGLVGCGDIARKAYLPFAKEKQSTFEVVACCDVRQEVAVALAAEFDIPKVHERIEELIADPEVEVVLNLTHPAAHAPVNLQALRAGKHAYCEKPFALTREEGEEVLAAAREKNLQVGCAPDTVLGVGIQSCRKLLEDGAIGKPLFAKIHMGGAGHEHWHPNPAFYYQQGGGPMLDMGPYYLSALVQLLGPIQSVEGRAVSGFETRTIGSEPLKGTVIPVQTPTHYVGSMQMACGVIVQVLFSFDLKFGADGSNLPEIYGTEGTLRCTDPNGFKGEPMLNQVYPRGELKPQAPAFSYEGGRGLGLVDMIQAIQENRAPRASGEIAHHILEAMLAFHDSEATGKRIALKSTCAQPPMMDFTS
ncbi:MAG: Gfo/Idh/MocA family oxidoreductase [Verrucomicrobia bacterium]|nr:Gfo/Idh/MocA family oxidoreductase [Verrucomicrobiota bacterium]MCH8514322.1 Gfo/Idh/MocA family oxidoreductase [Kiritimatiellia bacterium]